MLRAFLKTRTTCIAGKRRSSTLRTNYECISADDKLIFGDGNTVYGNGNLIVGESCIAFGHEVKMIGDFARLYGNDGFIKGNFSKTYGSNNEINGYCPNVHETRELNACLLKSEVAVIKDVVPTKSYWPSWFKRNS
jgi:hypothetical protein